MKEYATWPDADVAQLTELFKAGKTPSEISRTMNRTARAVANKLWRMVGTSTLREAPDKWTDREKQLLINMRWLGKSWAQIGAAVGHPAEKCKSMHRSRGCSHLAVTAKIHRVEDKIVAPPEVIAEHTRRSSLRPRDLTAFLLGDPLPGYSALERRA